MTDKQPDLRCQNCKDRPGRLRSFDLDLRPVALCDLCTYAINDQALFDELGGRGPRRRTRRQPSAAELAASRGAS